MNQAGSTINQDAHSPFDGSPLPDGWRRVRLRDVILEAQGGFASGERDERGVIQLRMNNVTTNGQLDWSSYIRVPATSDTVEIYRLIDGDVLFNNTNSTELVGKSALFEGHNEPIVFSNHFTRLRTDKNLLEPSFLALWLQHQWQRHVFADICNRWIGQSAVQRDKLLALEALLPPIHEQKRIAAILKEQMAAVEQARIAAEAQIHASKELPAAYLRDIFESPCAKQWPKKFISDFARTCSGSTPSRTRADYYAGNIPWVKTGELRDGFISDTDEHVSETALHECSIKLLPADTLLIAMYGQGQTRGRTGLLTSPATTNQACFAILPNSEVFDSQYVQLWFRHNYSRLRRETEGRGGNQPNLNGAVLNRQQVPMPTIEEQKSIVEMVTSRLTVAEQVNRKLQERLNSINELPAALLRQAFSGRL